MKKVYLAFLGLLMVFTFFPGVVLAFGQMTQPINITNAIRGQKISQEVIIVNSENNQINVALGAEGQIKDWAKFYMPNNLTQALATTTIPAKSNLNMVVVFSVPDDIANGEYKGFVNATNIGDKKSLADESSASVSQKINRQVTIKITDLEVVSLDVSLIPETYDVAIDQPLKVRVIYDNQSNIGLSPQINFKIKQDDQVVYNVIFPYPDGEVAVNAKARQEISPLTIPTTGLAKGSYLAQLQFTRDDKVLVEKQFRFSVGRQGAVLGASVFNLLNNKLIVAVSLAVIVLLVFAVWMKKRRQEIVKEPINSVDNK